MKAGSVCIMDTGTYHKAGEPTLNSRWSIFSIYTGWFVKPYFDYRKIYKKFKMNENIKRILHYFSRPPEIDYVRIHYQRILMNKLNEIDLFLNKYWNSSKINQGDSILLHANASRLVKNCLKIDKNFHTNSILKTLLAKIGPTGTIIVPTFSFKSINNKFFDIKKTPSEMGIISELVEGVLYQ